MGFGDQRVYKQYTDNPKLWRAWYFYDFANSGFYTTVITVFAGPFITELARAAANEAGQIGLLGLSLHYGAYFPYLVSVSVFLQVLLLPLLGAVADSSGRRKLLLGVFAYTGAAATIGLAFLTVGQLAVLGFLFVFANVAFGASVVVYNAYLPDLASPEYRDAVSCRGWALGYLGGAILLSGNLVFLDVAPTLGFTAEQAVRICLASAGVWWMLFTIIPLAGLPADRVMRAQSRVNFDALARGFRELAATLRLLQLLPQTTLFLVAYLLYNDGIQSVIALASQFGYEELKIPVNLLALAVLLVQFVAFGGSLLFGRLAKWLGTKRALLLSLVIWCALVGYAAVALQSVAEYFGLAAGIGVVLGGSQALSRSLYSLLIPKGYEAQFFSLYEIGERGTSWLGPLLFGLSLEATGSYRVAIFALLVFFVSGAFVLQRVNVTRGSEQARLMGTDATAG